MNGRFFANGVGLGFDGAVAEEAAKVRYLKGFPAYLWSVFKVLRTWENFELTLTVDGRTVTGRAFLAAVANGPRSGGGFLLAPDAKPDDGLLDVCRLGDLGKLEALRHLPKALDGSHVGLPWATILRGTRGRSGVGPAAHRSRRREPRDRSRDTRSRSGSGSSRAPCASSRRLPE